MRFLNGKFEKDLDFFYVNKVIKRIKNELLGMSLKTFLSESIWQKSDDVLDAL